MLSACKKRRVAKKEMMMLMMMEKDMDMVKIAQSLNTTLKLCTGRGGTTSASCAKWRSAMEAA